MRKEDNQEATTMLDEIQRRLSSLETIVKPLVEVDKDKKSKEYFVTQVHLYLCYIHQMDITLADGQGVQLRS